MFRFSVGNLPGAVNPAVSLANDVLGISWDILGSAQGNLSDQMMVLLYDTTNSRTLSRIFDGPFRGAESYSITISASMKGGEAEMYIGFYCR